MGRLFDAVAFLLDCGALVSYEAEAAVALEALALEATDARGAYAFEWKAGPGGYTEIDPAPVVTAIVDDLAKGRELTAIAAAFHRGVAGLVVDLATELSKAHGCTDVVLSGGVFQNRFLCECVMERAQGFAAALPPARARASERRRHRVRAARRRRRAITERE